MVARGRERAARAGAGNIEFVHADVQVHNLREARFDGAYSRFSVMFSTDPVAAFACGALRPGECLSFVCWQTLCRWAGQGGAEPATFAFRAAS
jgi:hypothetical protein